MGKMMKIIFVQWYEQQSHRENRLHKRGVAGNPRRTHFSQDGLKMIPF